MPPKGSRVFSKLTDDDLRAELEAELKWHAQLLTFTQDIETRRSLGGSRWRITLLSDEIARRQDQQRTTRSSMQ